MNQKSIDKIIKVIRSIETVDQFKTAVDWIFRLRKLYNIPIKYEVEFQKEIMKVIRDKSVQ